MNNRRTVADWERVAVEFGYPTMKDMLHQYYVNRNMTTRDIGTKVLDVSKDRVVQLLRLNGIPLRRRGGIR